MQETPRSFLALFAPCEDREKWAACNLEESLTEPNQADPLIPDGPASLQNYEKSILTTS